MSISSWPIDYAVQIKPLRYPAMYLGFLAVAETVTIYYLHTGLLIHICILSALLVHSAMTEDKQLAGLLTALFLAPLIRILGLSTPLIHFNQVAWFAIVSVPVFIAAITIARLQGIPARNIGLGPPNPRYFPLELAVIGVCILIGFLEYYILRPNALADFQFQSMLAPSLVLLVNTGFMEEAVFRGLMQYHAVKMGGIWGIVLISVLFGILHITNQTFYDAALAGGVGLIFGLVIHKTGTIWMMSIAHAMVNINLFIIAPNVLGD